MGMCILKERLMIWAILFLLLKKVFMYSLFIFLIFIHLIFINNNKAHSNVHPESPELRGVSARHIPDFQKTHYLGYLFFMFTYSNVS